MITVNAAKQSLLQAHQFKKKNLHKYEPLLQTETLFIGCMWECKTPQYDNNNKENWLQMK